MVCLVYINYIYIYMNPYKKNDPDTFITKIVMRVHTHTHTHTQTISRSLTSTRTHSARYRKIDLCFLSNWTNHEHIFSSYTSPYISPWRFTIFLTVIYCEANRNSVRLFQIKLNERWIYSWKKVKSRARENNSSRLLAVMKRWPLDPRSYLLSHDAGQSLGLLLFDAFCFRLLLFDFNEIKLSRKPEKL